MEIKWYGTAAVSLTSERRSILFDPFLSLNKRLSRFSAGELAEAGEILITHGHFDHLIDVPKVMAAGNAPVYCSDGAASSLLREKVSRDRIAVVRPGDSFRLGPFKVTVFKGRHIKFDGRLIIKTLFNRRVLTYAKNLRVILKESRHYPEGEVLVYALEVEGKKILHMGSLNLDDGESYPERVDLLTLPFQGRSDIGEYAMQFVRRLNPQTLYLHHFDDTFPPVSSPVKTEEFVTAAVKSFPGIKVFVPKYGEPLAL